MAGALYKYTIWTLNGMEGLTNAITEDGLGIETFFTNILGLKKKLL